MRNWMDIVGEEQLGEAGRARRPKPDIANIVVPWKVMEHNKLHVGSTTISYAVLPRIVQIADVDTPVADRGQGQARRAMMALVAEADKRKVPIELLSYPQDDLTKQGKLNGFYRSLGFQKRRNDPDGGVLMIRYPRVTEMDEDAKLPLTKHALPNVRGLYAAFIVVMDPADFIRLATPPNEVHQIYADKFAKSVADYKAGTDEQFNKQNYFMPYLFVDFETGKVKGHEGRHRAAMIEKEGGKRFPCAIIFREPVVWECSWSKMKFVDGEFDYDNEEKESKEFKTADEAHEFKAQLEKLNNQAAHEYYYSDFKIEHYGGSAMRGPPRSEGWTYKPWLAEDMPKQLVSQFDSSVIVPTDRMRYGPVKGYSHFK